MVINKQIKLNKNNRYFLIGIWIVMVNGIKWPYNPLFELLTLMLKNVFDIDQTELHTRM